MNNIGIIMKKELFRVFGDRKLVFSIFILPAIVMIAVYSMIGKLASSMSDDIEKHICTTTIVNATDELKSCIAASGYDKSAEIVYLTESEYAAKKADLEKQILDGEYDLVVYLPANFNEIYSNYKNAGDAVPEIVLSYNSTENYSAQAYSLFSQTALGAYSQFLLINRVGNLEALNVFNAKPVEIVNETKANSQFIAMMLPYMVMIMLFAGAMSIGVDSFAGEKERGTLAYMLVSPVKRTEIAMGKLIGLAIISALSSIVYSVSMIFSLTFMGGSITGAETEGLSGVSFDAVQIIQLLLMLIVVDYFFVAIVALLSTLAKDTKSASTYVTPVYMLVLVSAMCTMFSVGTRKTLGQYCIPLYGTALALQDICTGELTAVNFAVAFGMMLLTAVAATFALSKVFDSEKIMFNA